jgi:hypothetical protein
MRRERREIMTEALNGAASALTVELAGTVKKKWTIFFDKCSGGSEKLGVCTIWIEASEREATDLFEQMFERDPHNVTCDCCGEDYFVSEAEPKFGNGDWVVTDEDIERFKGGHFLPANAPAQGCERSEHPTGA